MEILSTNRANHSFGRRDIYINWSTRATRRISQRTCQLHYIMITVLTKIITEFFFLSYPGFIRPVVVRLVGDISRSGYMAYIACIAMQGTPRHSPRPPITKYNLWIPIIPIIINIILNRHLVNILHIYFLHNLPVTVTIYIRHF